MWGFILCAQLIEDEHHHHPPPTPSSNENNNNNNNNNNEDENQKHNFHQQQQQALLCEAWQVECFVKTMKFLAKCLGTGRKKYDAVLHAYASNDGEREVMFHFAFNHNAHIKKKTIASFVEDTFSAKLFVKRRRSRAGGLITDDMFELIPGSEAQCAKAFNTTTTASSAAAAAFISQGENPWLWRLMDMKKRTMSRQEQKKDEMPAAVQHWVFTKTAQEVNTSSIMISEEQQQQQWWKREYNEVATAQTNNIMVEECCSVGSRPQKRHCMETTTTAGSSPSSSSSSSSHPTHSSRGTQTEDNDNTVSAAGALPPGNRNTTTTTTTTCGKTTRDDEQNYYYKYSLLVLRLKKVEEEKRTLEKKCQALEMLLSTESHAKNSNNSNQQQHNPHHPFASSSSSFEQSSSKGKGSKEEQKNALTVIRHNIIGVLDEPHGRHKENEVFDALIDNMANLKINRDMLLSNRVCFLGRSLWCARDCESSIANLRNVFNTKLNALPPTARMSSQSSHTKLEEAFKIFLGLTQESLSSICHHIIAPTPSTALATAAAPRKPLSSLSSNMRQAQHDQKLLIENLKGDWCNFYERDIPLLHAAFLAATHLFFQ